MDFTGAYGIGCARSRSSMWKVFSKLLCEQDSNTNSVAPKRTTRPSLTDAHAYDMASGVVSWVNWGLILSTGAWTRWEYVFERER